jgi:hypothetical protein
LAEKVGTYSVLEDVTSPAVDAGLETSSVFRDRFRDAGFFELGITLLSAMRNDAHRQPP